MAARPLPGATYHTADLAFHSFPDVDLEAVDPYGPSEKTRMHSPVQTPQGMARLRRGPPVMLILLLLCCLTFAASAFVGSALDEPFVMPMLCVPERNTPLAAQIFAASRNESNKEWVYGTQQRALDILYVRTLHCAHKLPFFHWLTLRHRKQKFNTSRGGCHAANVRDYMRQTYSVLLVIYMALSIHFRAVSH